LGIEWWGEVLTFSALVSGNGTGAFEVVEGEDVLQFGFGVDYRSRALLLPLLEHIDYELFNIFRLLVAEDGGDVLGNKLKKGVTSKSSMTLCFRR